MIDLTKITVALVELAVTLAVVYLIPYIRAKLGAEKTAKVQRYVKMAVEAAEMLYRESGMGAAKKEYVKSWLEERGFKLDYKELDILIESAVLQLKHGLEG